MLYNEFRPKTFKEVRGQKENKRILQNQLLENNPSHAYVFNGLHGSGKTTCARIFARGLNCENPQNGEPCGCCDSCREFEKGINNDIYEIDAASNNKVEDVSKIKDAIMYPPQRKYKVFILDEAHMLSKVAWNSLLTTIEEAPHNSIFIFCSTEINKFPSTIVSRCMNLTFSNISNKEIIENLKNISETKNYKYEIEGLSLIASISNGSMRDALSNLEKCVSYGDLTPVNVANTLGLVDQSNVFDIIKSMVTGDIEGMLDKIDVLFNLGKDMYELTKDILESLRDINVYAITKNESIINKNIEYVSAFNVDTKEITLAVNKYYLLLDSIKNADNKKILLDIASMEVSSLFTNAKVGNFNTTINNISKNTYKTEEDISKKEDEKSNVKNNKEEEENYFNYLPKIVNLFFEYDYNDKDLEILINSRIYTKHNCFVIKGKISELNKEKTIEKINHIYGKSLKVKFIEV